MLLYLTDNHIIQKKIPGAILAYQIFNWRIKHNPDIEDDSIAYILNKTYKLKEIKQKIKSSLSIYSIVSRSNYKLIFDILSIKKKDKKIFFWDSFKERKQFAINKKKVSRLMSGYLIRGYFSLLMYDQLGTLNMQRIEQFIISVALKYNTHLHTSYIDLYEDDLFNYKLNDKSIPVFKLINSLFFAEYDYNKIIDKLMYHARRLDITDPFCGYFEFLNKNNSLYKKHMEFKTEEIHEKTLLLINLYYQVSSIIPLVDFLKTLRFLMNNELINNDFKLLEYLDNFITEDFIGFLNKATWSEIYENKAFYLSDSLPYIDITKNQVFCPVCGSTSLKRTPRNYYCSDTLCSFSVNASINATGKIKKISEYDLSRLLKYGSTIIKNRSGGYNRYKIIKGENGKYHILPENKNNDVGSETS